MGLRRCLMAAVLVAVPAMTFSPVLAQSSGLSTEVVMSSTSLNAAQQNHVNQYVSRWMDKLISEDPAAISEGRRRLMEPFTLPGVTELFLAAYSPAVTRELVARTVLANTSVLIRTNAMIVASRLTDGGVVQLIQQGLKDQAAAVRYWAAVAAANAGKRLNAADQQSVLQALTNGWENETSIDVLEKILVAMNALTTPEAGLQLLTVLNHRVNVHAGNPALPIKAELEGLQGITIRTFTALTADGHNVSPALLKQLVIVLFRYLDLSTDMLEHAQTAGPNGDDLRRMTLIAGNYLPRLAEKLSPNAPFASLATRQASPNDPAANRLLVEEWRRLLVSPSFGLTTGQLAIQPTKPAQPGAPAAPVTPSADAPPVTTPATPAQP